MTGNSTDHWGILLFTGLELDFALMITNLQAQPFHLVLTYFIFCPFSPQFSMDIYIVKFFNIDT